MSLKFGMSSALNLAFTVTLTVIGVGGSGVVAQNRTPHRAGEPEIADAPAVADGLAATTLNRKNLAALVSAQPTGDLPRDLECLAGAVYFEAKSETLEGQLAVGRVIVNRARSGRFPASYCGVVFQRSQFSFVRGKGMPVIDRRSRSWKKATAIAQIAHSGAWTSAAEGALFFHAARVSPGWRLTRIARVDSHIFYR